MNDYELKLFAGFPLFDKSVGLVNHYSLNDIAEKGESNYRLFINLISIDKNSFSNLENKDKLNELSNFELLLLSIIPNNNLFEIFLSNLKFILKKDIEFDEKKCCFIIDGNKSLNKNNYDDFISLVKLLNCVIDTEEFLTAQQLANANSLVKEYLLKREMANKKVAEQKKLKSENNNENLTLTDLISIFLIGNSTVSYKDVWDLPFYAFNVLFSRMHLFYEFDVNVQVLLTGAKGVKLRDWTGKIPR